MSLLDKASLVQIPSGYKNGKLYSVKPSNGNGDFTFARSSSATRVNAEGYIETAQILGSEEITAFTNGTTYPFTTFATSGNNITSAIISSSFAGTVSNGISLTSGEVYKVSFDYVKNSGDDLRVLFSNSVSGAGAQISNVENISVSGTYNLYFTITSTTTGYLQMGTGSSSHSLNIAINNVSVKEVTQNDVPRLDYSGGATCASLLLEPQRTNNILQSNQLDTTWVLTNATITGNQSGIYNSTDAWKLVGNGSNNDRIDSNSLSSGAYTFSIYAKAGNSKFVAVVLGSGVVYYNLEIGSIGSQASVTSASIESVGNEWYRLNMSVASGSGSVQVYIANAVGSVNTSNGDFVYLQHAQAEVGSYSTSIIKTTSATATRTADVCNNAGTSATFNSTEGVLFAEIAALTEVGDGTTRLSISDGSQDNNITIGYSATNTLRTIIRSGASNQALMTSSQTITNYLKVGVKYKANDFALWVNGVEVATDTSGLAPVGLSELSFDRGDAALPFYGKVKQLIVFDEALSDSELATLTTL